VGVVVGNTRSRVGRLDAEPVEHGEDGGLLQRRAVIAVQDGFVGEGMQAFGDRCPAEQMSGMIGMVGGLDGEADDFATEEIEDQVESDLVPEKWTPRGMVF